MFYKSLAIQVIYLFMLFPMIKIHCFEFIAVSCSKDFVFTKINQLFNSVIFVFNNSYSVKDGSP